MSQLARAVQNAKYDFDAFLLFLDSRPDERWELIDGHPIMMAGGTLDHNTIALNIARLLYPFARARGCRVQTSDVLVRNLEYSDFAALPDVLVHCGPRQGQERFLTDPSIIVEVLSRSTILFDRGERFARYRTLPSVQQILFVYQNEVRVESWRRAGDADGPASDLWMMESVNDLRQEVRFTSLDADISVSDIYDDAMPRISAV